MKTRFLSYPSLFRPWPFTWRGGAARLVAALVVAAACAGGEAASAGLLDKADQTRYRAAFEAAAKGNWTAARQQAAKGRDPLPGKILTWLEMAEPGNRHSFSEITRFVAENPDWPRLYRLRRSAEEAITEETPTAAVLAWFSAHPPSTADGMIAYGQALVSAGKPDQGYAMLRRAWIEGHFSRRAELLFMRQYRKRFTDKDHWARLDRLLWDGHHREAERMLPRVSADLRALATARARLRRMQGGVDAAIARVPQALQRDPGLMYERLRWRRRKDRDVDAVDILKSPPDRMVRPELWSVERVILARRLLAEGRITDAWRAVRDHGLTPEHGAYFAEAEWLSGWIALRFLKEAGEAKRRFETFYNGVQYPVSRARAAYWAGRAASMMNDETAAIVWYGRAARYPTTYHGQLATLALGQTMRFARVPPKPSDDAIRRFESHELARAVRLLKELDQEDHMRPFLVRLSRLDPSPGHKALAGRLAQSVGRPDLGVWVARYAQRDGTQLLAMGYPVLPEMPDGRPERALLLAVARQESNFYAEAISRAGARGIMQLMPATARTIARQHRMRYSRAGLTRDPEYNIRLGRQYLADMLDRFDGSYLLAAAAYNAGPTAVSRWIARHGDPRSGVDDPIDWIEMIPYGETRDYVQRVLGNLQVFRHRLQPGNVAMTLDRDLRR